MTPVYRHDRLAEIKVRVINKRAGHNLPTSLTNIRQLWLDITARDTKGSVLMSSGTVDSQGKISPDVRMFNSEGQHEGLHFALDPWEIQCFAKHDTIPPKGYEEVFYGLTAPKGSPITIEVKLRYRQADQKVAEKLQGLVPEDIHLEAIYGIKEVPILPVIDMVSKRVTINNPTNLCRP